MEISERKRCDEKAKKALGGAFIVYWTAVSRIAAYYNPQTKAMFKSFEHEADQLEFFDRMKRLQSEGKSFGNCFPIRITKVTEECPI